MINISQIEKFTESGVSSVSLSSGEPAAPGIYRKNPVKIICSRDESAEFTFAASCGNKA
jgi:hypothetical protein